MGLNKFGICFLYGRTNVKLKIVTLANSNVTYNCYDNAITYEIQEFWT